METRKRSVVLEPQLYSCCCCSLRTGCQIIGWYHVIFGCLVLIKLYPTGFSYIADLYGNGTDLHGAKILFVITLVLTQAQVISAIYLLVGINQMRPGYLKVFTRVAVLQLVYSLIVFLLYIFTKIGKDVAKTYEPVGPEYSLWMGHPGVLVLASAITLYMLLVAVSYYRELKRISQQFGSVV